MHPCHVPFTDATTPIPAGLWRLAGADRGVEVYLDMTKTDPRDAVEQAADDPEHDPPAARLPVVSRRTVLELAGAAGVGAGAVTLATSPAVAQEDDDGGDDGEGEPDGENGGDQDGGGGDGYSVDIDAEFAPFTVGQRAVLEGDEDDDGDTVTIRVEITVLDEVEEVAGVTTRVVEEREWEAEEGDSFDEESLVEVSRNFLAQSSDGTVWYFGEDVDEYEDGEVVGNPGAWRADGETTAPGVYMPAWPVVGSVFQREIAPGVAEDVAAITDADVSVTVPYGEFDGCLALSEWNPLEGGEGPEDGDEKVFAPGVGLIVDEAAELVEFEPGS
ncbi:hypothetical protein [Halobaculum marinum]|uniref:Tat (Twin-arginine translocation) pathway signal sequence n=1 Tax=Halobaculum marinum TaxID=3031996 RepID=A0ABD5X3C0_9EURY|nr:hypothetical protein [Halobaculum sp. DT55]